MINREGKGKRDAAARRLARAMSLRDMRGVEGMAGGWE